MFISRFSPNSSSARACWPVSGIIIAPRMGTRSSGRTCVCSFFFRSFSTTTRMEERYSNQLGDNYGNLSFLSYHFSTHCTEIRTYTLSVYHVALAHLRIICRARREENEIENSQGLHKKYGSTRVRTGDLLCVRQMR